MKKIFFLSGRRHYKSDEHNNRKIRHQRPRSHSFINDLKTTEFSEKSSFSADLGKNYKSDEHKNEKFGISDLKNLYITYLFNKCKKK